MPNEWKDAFLMIVGGFSSIIGNWILSDTNSLEKSEPRDIVLNTIVGVVIVMISLGLCINNQSITTHIF